jgi:hypothetical protein
MAKRTIKKADYHQYTDRYCAFVDVLGFTELIGNISKSRTAQEKHNHFHIVRNLLLTVHSSPEHPDDPFDFSKLKAQSISDAVAISAAVHPLSLFVMIDLLERFALNLLKEGFFVRGAVVRGPLYHDDRMVFGEALIRAYRLESEVARYPRIILERKIIDDISKATEETTSVLFSGRVIQADDGPWYVHVLRQMGCIVNDTPFAPRDEHLDPAMYIAIQKWLQDRLDRTADDPRRFEKVQWFAAYWNRTHTDNPDGIKCIFGPAVGYRP